MNWPPLSQECSEAIADCLKTVVNEKPDDLLEFVATRLSQKSGLNPKEFEESFEECKRKPRSYVLEDQCPLDQDPLSWVPMRYNDDTIFESLRSKAGQLATDILTENQPCPYDTPAMVSLARSAFPELAYLRGSSEEKTALRTLRALYLGTSGYKDVLETGLQDDDSMLSFTGHSIMVWLRGILRQNVQAEDMWEAVFIACMLRILGSNAGFRQKFGGGLEDPDKAILHAMDNEIESLPSFQRLQEHFQTLIDVSLQSAFPFSSVTTTEVVPAQFEKVKTDVACQDFGLGFFLSVLVLEHAVKCSNMLGDMEDAELDIIRLGAQSLMAIDKHPAPKAYELFLKKRAERVEWRLSKDDYPQRSIVRLCCLAGLTDADSWNQMQSIVDGLAEAEKDALKNELGRKDGVADLPCYIVIGASKLLEAANRNEEVGLAAAVQIIARVLDDTARSFDKTIKEKTMRLRFDGVTARASQRSSVPFEDTAFVVEEVDGELLVRVGG